ncbi:S-adenosyl-L-methionine-dependent methyltransferase [Lophium mytilinum]|uniref:S-adenosyl-L-methionine-dependent methyltransferase n=1 Tax=Lophium mytilinum TaxID=390894 RepID=A0A6A6QMA1_9PEZI|nr:S-adenosyl-L-methionine-dependent methyltransferase [Lophium mytilinum]
MANPVHNATTTLAESIWSYRVEHGRTYHAYKDGNYIFPNDDQEKDRLDLQHHLFNLCFKDKLFFAPVREPKHVLDVGTGTGIWALDFVQVVGTDLSPIQPSFVPPNLSFIIDDAEDEWLWKQKFDLIHLRLMGGSFRDWQAIIQSAYDNLAPGGYLEIQDYVLPARSPDETVKGTDLERWGELLIEAAGKAGRPIDASKHFRQYMLNAGFDDIHELSFAWPTNPWPKDKDLKMLGRWNLVNITDGMEGFCLALLTRVLDWKKEEVDILCAKVKSDLKNRAIHGYFEIPVVYGRKL